MTRMRQFKPGTFRILILLAMSAIWLSGSQQNASAADWCSRAKSATEKTICGSPELKDLDVRLSQSYSEALRNETASNKKIQKSKQRAWLTLRRSCGTDLNCLKASYISRLRDLSGQTETSVEDLPSWCRSAKTAAEITVCTNPDLAAAEIKRSDNYFAKYDAANTAQKSTLKMEQRAWIASRERCGSNITCLRDAYGIAANIGSLVQSNSQQVQTSSGIEISRIKFDFFSGNSNGEHMDALLAGNSQYRDLPSLATPENDVRLISSALRAKGISTSEYLNPDNRSALLDRLEAYRKSERKDLFIFYYAGHALNINGRPSILFRDFDSSATADDSYLPLDILMSKIAHLGYKRILVAFDGCRDINLNLNASKAKLSSVDSASLNVSTLKGAQYAILFSASMGQAAIDSLNGINSPFASSFADTLLRSHSMITAFNDTRREVATETKNRQTPSLQLSLNGDISLDSSLLNSVTIDLREPITLHPKRHLEDFQSYTIPYSDTRSTELVYSAKKDRDCPEYNPINAGFTFSLNHYLWCFKTYYGEKDVDVITLPKYPLPENGFVQYCDSASVEADINADGKYEKFVFSSSKYGLYVAYDNVMKYVDYYSGLGCNFSQLAFYDFDRDSTQDILAIYSDSGDEYHDSSMAILSGAKFLSGFNMPRTAAYEQSGPKTDTTDEWLASVGGLSKVALFYDKGIKALDRIQDGSLYYKTFEHTYGSNPSSCYEDKEVSFNRDGTSIVSCDDGKYVVPRFDSPYFKVRPY